MGSSSYYVKTVASHFNYVTVELCTNDIAGNVTLANFKTYMYGVASTVNAGNARTRVVCFGPPPRAQWTSGNATLANQTAEYTTSWNAIEGWFTGGTLISDCASNGATVYGAVDVTQVATTFGPSGFPSSLVLSFNSSGNYIWNSNAQVLWRGTFTSGSSATWTDSSMSGDMSDLKGAYITDTTVGLSQSIVDFTGAKTMRLFATIAGAAIGDSYTGYFNPSSDVGAGGGVHPNTNGHQYLMRRVLATGLYVAFNCSPPSGVGGPGLSGVGLAIQLRPWNWLGSLFKVKDLDSVLQWPSLSKASPTPRPRKQSLTWSTSESSRWKSLWSPPHSRLTGRKTSFRSRCSMRSGLREAKL